MAKRCPPPLRNRSEMLCSLVLCALMLAGSPLTAEAGEIYHCSSPQKGRAGAPSVVRPGEPCPSELRPGGEIVIEFQLDRAVPLQLEVAFARTTDHYDLPGDLEVHTGRPPGGDKGGPCNLLRLDSAPYGEREGGGIVTLLPAKWLREGRNGVALSMRRVDFPGVALDLASLRISTGPVLPEARKTFEAVQETQSRQRREAERRGEALRQALTNAPYRAAVEDSLHKLFQDELQLVTEECQDGVAGRPWSMRRSRLTGRFLPSLLADEQPGLLLEACRGEQESGQVVVVPCTSDLHRVTVKCDGLRSPEGRTISRGECASGMY